MNKRENNLKLNYVGLWLTVFIFLFSANEILARPKLIPKTPSIAAKSYIMVDYDSGKILASENADEQVEPASITKLMTAYVIFDELSQGNISLSDEVTISKKAWQTQGSRMFIRVNSKVSVELLLQGMIIQSGNDASVALAEYVAGSEGAFAALMNQHALSLGMKNTHFVNSTGLPDEQHLTTAKDLAKLAAALIRRFPEYYKWYSVKSFKYNKINQFNRNKLLWRDKTVDGMKTGYTKNAGYCLVASSKRDNMRLITIVLGTKSASARAQESQKLLNFGFRFYETHELYKAGVSVKQIDIYKGQQDKLDIGLINPLYITIPRGDYKNLKPIVNVQDRILAPMAKGQELGNISIQLGETLIKKVPLVSLNDVPEGSFFKRLKDSILLLFK